MTASYLEKFFKVPNHIIKLAEKHIPGQVEFIVGRGVSGAMSAPLIAHALKLPFVIVRKDDPTSHSHYPIEGITLTKKEYVCLQNPKVRKWAFVDDLIDTGFTLDKTKKIIKEKMPQSLFQGAFFFSIEYSELDFLTPWLSNKQLSKRFK